MKSFFALLHHEIKLHLRQASDSAALLLFFIIVIVLMPFALGPEPEILRRLAPGLIWLAALLMSLLSLDRLFVQDARDGTLDIWLTTPTPLPLLVLAKILAHSVLILSALTLMMFPAALVLGMDAALLPVLLLSFVLGVPCLVFLGGMAGAITVALQRNPALLTLLLIPFYIPVLIFAVSACDAAAAQTSPASNLLLLGAILALVAPSAPFVIAAALRSGQG